MKLGCPESPVLGSKYCIVHQEFCGKSNSKKVSVVQALRELLGGIVQMCLQA